MGRENLLLDAQLIVKIIIIIIMEIFSMVIKHFVKKKSRLTMIFIEKCLRNLTEQKSH